MHWVAETESQLQKMVGTESEIKEFQAEAEERDAEKNKQQQADYNGESSDYQREMEG